MHIAAVMAALDVWDLDRNAKMALLVVACRADQYTALAEVSIGRVAADMKVGYYAAAHGLDRAVASGYLTVDKSRGQKPLWQLTSAVNLRDPENKPPRYLRDSEHQPPRSRPRTKDSKEKDMKERGAASLAQTASGAAGENPRRLALVANGAPAPGRCPACDGTGWKVGPGGQSFACRHE